MGKVLPPGAWLCWAGVRGCPCNPPLQQGGSSKGSPQHGDLTDASVPTAPAAFSGSSHGRSSNFTSLADARGQICVPGCRESKCVLIAVPFLLMPRYSPPALRFTLRGKLTAKMWNKRGIFLHLPCIQQRAAQRVRFTWSGEWSLVICPVPSLWEALGMSPSHFCIWELKINPLAQSQLES